MPTIETNLELCELSTFLILHLDNLLSLSWGETPLPLNLGVEKGGLVGWWLA